MRSIFYWLIGGFESTRWEHLIITIPLISFSSLILLFKSKEINMIMLSDDYASSLGINVNRTLLVCLFFTNTIALDFTNLQTLKAKIKFFKVLELNFIELKKKGRKIRPSKKLDNPHHPAFLK